jgi:putative Ca2+/H+ antiporter (TMEM165/GDT1 family)
MEAFLISTASAAVVELGDKTQLLCLILAAAIHAVLGVLTLLGYSRVNWDEWHAR